MDTLNILNTEVTIPADKVTLSGQLVLPSEANGVVLFAHGSGSSRHSMRNIYVASKLQAGGIGTLLFDLLTESEEVIDNRTGHLRFDINLLAERLYHATRWIQCFPATLDFNIGYFGASTGGAAALVTAGLLGDQISAVVSRGGRPDLAGDSLPRVTAPTLLIVGGFDKVVIELNRQAYAKLRCEKLLEIVPEASHLFEEPGKLEEVARLASGWFKQHLN